MDRKSTALLMASMAVLGGASAYGQYSLNVPHVPPCMFLAGGGRGPGRGHPKRYRYTRKNKNSSRARCMGRI